MDLSRHSYLAKIMNITLYFCANLIIDSWKALEIIGLCQRSYANQLCELHIIKLAAVETNVDLEV